jgi:hypothetical protein
MEEFKMPKMTNQAVINRFFTNPHSTNGKYIENHSGSLYISVDGTRLMNYSTVLVQRTEEYGLLINRTSYSNTTSKIQSWFMSELWKQYSPDFINEHTMQLNDVPMGTAYLDEYAKKHIEWAKGIKQVKVINYFDVWGSKKEGWEINNMCEEELDTELLQLHLNATPKEAFQLLKSVGFLKNTTRINQVDIEDMYDYGFEFMQRKDGMPICRIEFVR